MSNTETRISIENVYKIFGPDPKRVLELVRGGMSKQDVLEKTGHTVGIRDVSLEISAGEVYVIMGLSGSGKSTLIRHINRLIEPTSGRILVDGDDVLKLGQDQLRHLRRHKVSMVFQRFALLPHKTVLENSISGLLLRGDSQSDAHDRAMAQIKPPSWSTRTALPRSSSTWSTTPLNSQKALTIRRSRLMPNKAKTTTSSSPSGTTAPASQKIK